MKLSKYIEKVGDKVFAEQFSISERTAMSYRLHERMPKPELAQRIVERSPVTWAGIYEKNDKPTNCGDQQTA